MAPSTLSQPSMAGTVVLKTGSISHPAISIGSRGKNEWKGIASIAMAVRQRDVVGKVSTERSYYISSLESQASTIGNHIRNHWGIENDLHWSLDVSFQEDRCRVRKDHAPENFGILRHMATNLLKQGKSLKGGIQAKRLKTAWDHNYLLKLLGQ